MFPSVLFDLTGMRDHPPIPVTDLADNIDRLKANDGLKFSQEYEVRRLGAGLAREGIVRCFYFILFIFISLFLQITQGSNHIQHSFTLLFFSQQLYELGWAERE